MISVLVVDDHEVVREGLTAILDDACDIDVVAEAPSGEEALARLPDLMVDVAMIDIRLKGMSGIDLCRELSEKWPSVRSVMMTVFTSDIAMEAAFEAGARGYMFKNAQAAAIAQAVRTVASDAVYVDPSAADRLIALATRGRPRVRPGQRLTPAERRVLELIPGLTNQEIAEALGLSFHTVKSHIYHAMAKLGVHRRSEAAVMAAKEEIA